MIFHSFVEDVPTDGDSKGVPRIELIKIYRLVWVSVLEGTSDQILSDFTIFLLMFLDFLCFFKDFGGYKKLFLREKGVQWI